MVRGGQLVDDEYVSLAEKIITNGSKVNNTLFFKDLLEYQ